MRLASTRLTSATLSLRSRVDKFYFVRNPPKSAISRENRLPTSYIYLRTCPVTRNPHWAAGTERGSQHHGWSATIRATPAVAEGPFWSRRPMILALE